MTLRELANRLVETSSIHDVNGRDYIITNNENTDDGIILTVTSWGFRYTNIEPGNDIYDASYKLLIRLQMMGRFSSFRSDESIELINKKQKKSEKSTTKVKIVKEIVEQSPISDDVLSQTDTEINNISIDITNESNQSDTSPQVFSGETDINTIMKIVLGMH